MTALFFETIAQAARSEFSSQADKDRYFQELLLAAVRARKANGAFILICKSPGRVQIDFHKSMNVSGRDRDKIRNAALPYFKAKDFDAGLRSLGNGIASQLKAGTIMAEKSTPEMAPEATPMVIDRRPATPAIPMRPSVPYRPGPSGFGVAPFVVLVFLVIIGTACFMAWRYVRGEGGGVHAKNRERSIVDATQSRDSSRRKGRHSRNDDGPISGVDPLGAGMMGYILGSADNSPASPPPIDHGSSGFDVGSSGGDGGGFSGGSGGDF